MTLILGIWLCFLPSFLLGSFKCLRPNKQAGLVNDCASDTDPEAKPVFCYSFWWRSRSVLLFSPPKVLARAGGGSALSSAHGVFPNVMQCSSSLSTLNGDRPSSPSHGAICCSSCALCGHICSLCGTKSKAMLKLVVSFNLLLILTN